MAEVLQFVAFRVGTQLFAVEIHRVIEVISLCEITPLPGAPPFIEGMIDLRGQLVPVIDMRKRIGVADIRNVMQTRIVIARTNTQRVGLIVDEADQVYTISTDQIEPPPEQGAEFVLAVARHEQMLLLILDLDTLLSGVRALHNRTALPDHART